MRDFDEFYSCKGCGSGRFSCRFHRFRFHFVVQILVAIPPTKTEAVNRFHIPNSDIDIVNDSDIDIEVRRHNMSLQIEDGNRDGDDVEPAVKCCKKPIECICSLFSAVKNFLKTILASSAFFYATLLFTAVMYIVDIGSDIKLAVRYYLDRNYWWGGWTTAFVAIPWMIYLVIAGVLLGGDALNGDL